MGPEGGLDYVPEYLSPEAKQRLLALTKETEPQDAPLEVNEYLIRHWCETVEDGNPLYLDEEYARSRGFRGLVAPPGTVMTTFAQFFRWPWPPGGREPQRHLHYDVKEALGLPVAIIQGLEIEYGVPLQVGDRLNITQRLTSVSPWKKTRLGEGHFWTIERTYRNQNGEVVARERLTAFGYGKEEGSPDSGTSAKGGWSPAVEEAIQGDKTGYQPVPPRTVFWEDVVEGEVLPELRMPITFTRCVYLASATRDFSPQHSNRDYAQQRSKTRDVFVNTPFNMGMVSRFMTDWAGPLSTVRRMKITMRGNVCAGDEMIITGTVQRKYVEDGEHRVDLDITISTQDGPVTPCSATLALPVRSATGQT